MGLWNTLITNVVRSGICAAAATGQDIFATLTRDVWGGDGGPPGMAPAGHFYREFCENPPPPPPPPSGFLGGQCPVVYRFGGTYKFNIYNTTSGAYIQTLPSTPTVYENTITGPILEYKFEVLRGPSTTTMRFMARNATQTVVAGQATTANFHIDRRAPFDVVLNPPVRVDGQPDTCGNRPPADPPTTIIRPFTFVFNPPGVPPVTINGDINISTPTFNINGRLEIPVNLTFNDPLLNIPIEIPVSVDISTGGVTVGGDGGVGGGPGGGGDPPPTRDPRVTPLPPPGETVGGPPGGGPPPPSDNPGGDDPPPPLPPDQAPGLDRKLIGVLTWVDSPWEGASQVFDNDSPKLYLPDIGHVVFKVSVAGSISYMEPIPIKYRRQWIPCPDPAGAVGASVINRPDVPVKISYVYDSRGLRST